jgi:hypothetical protein
LEWRHGDRIGREAEIEEEQGEATMKRRVREADIDATKARAEAMFQRKHEAQTATDEYRAEQKASLAKTELLRAARLAREAVEASAPGVKLKSKPKGKTTVKRP